MKPDLSLDALLVLDAIARRGSFGAAAEELHRAPSSVTYAVQKLEERLGVMLFDRRGHRAVLTPAGELLLNEGRELLTLADGITRNVRQVATGWEAELRIAVGDVVPWWGIFTLCGVFDDTGAPTRLRLSTEVLGGTWDALFSGRADLVIGAVGEVPAGGGYAFQPLGEVEFVFVVAPGHPLAGEPEPLPADLVRRYRAVAAADSSRGLAPRTVGLLPGQPVLTVSDLSVKRLAQIRGLGVGHLPRHLVAEDLAAGRLVEKVTEEGVDRRFRACCAWRRRNRGKALAWFRERLRGKGREWFAVSSSARGGAEEERARYRGSSSKTGV